MKWYINLPFSLGKTFLPIYSPIILQLFNNNIHRINVENSSNFLYFRISNFKILNAFIPFVFTLCYLDNGTSINTAFINIPKIWYCQKPHYLRAFIFCSIIIVLTVAENVVYEMKYRSQMQSGCHQNICSKNFCFYSWIDKTTCTRWIPDGYKVPILRWLQMFKNVGKYVLLLLWFNKNLIILRRLRLT